MVAFPVHVGHGSTVHGDSPGKNTGVGSHALLQGTFPSQGSNPHLLHCRWILYQLTHLESPIIILLLTKKQNKANCPQVLAPSPLGIAPSTAPQLTYHGVLWVCLLVMHLPNLLVCGCVDLTQHTEPLAVGRRQRGLREGQPLHLKNSNALFHLPRKPDISSEQL